MYLQHVMIRMYAVPLLCASGHLMVGFMFSVAVAFDFHDESVIFYSWF